MWRRIQRLPGSRKRATHWPHSPMQRRHDNRMPNRCDKHDEAVRDQCAPAQFIEGKEVMTTVFPAWDIPSVAVAGTDARFPVRHIYCVGRNYAEHAKEMGGDASKEPP